MPLLSTQVSLTTYVELRVIMDFSVAAATGCAHGSDDQPSTGMYN